ncbi:MAG: exopolyphosphatase [Rhodobacteraceae bacterium]|nr:MAG: exopolyphosphatase [Paracoccaceae bacterium]
MQLKPEPHADWTPFGRPLFDDADARALSRVGVVDVGSNSVRLVVFDGAARSPAYFYNEKVMCGLGASLSETGRLDVKGRARALGALTRFAHLARGMDLPPLSVVATAAVRDASDGAEFCAEVADLTGLRISVIPGEEEARLSAQGVLLGWPGAYGLVCDIGGASMELAEIASGRVGRRVTSELGPLKLRDIKGGRKGRKAHIKTVVERLRAEIGPQRDRLFLVGGSWRAIAKIDMARRGYPLAVLHEYRMSASSVRDTIEFTRGRDLDELRAIAGVSAARMTLVPYALEVLARLLSTFKPRDIAVSSYGIREGLLYEQMPQRLRDRDPLIEACYFAESKDARLPGFGKTLFQFVSPLFKAGAKSQKRLIKAACLLHDVSWRAHPDYRAEVCFDNATRANMGGLKHSERVFLGLALLHRYSSKRTGTRFDPLIGLLDDKRLKQAEILGRAMRFGAMLWPQMQETHLAPMASLHLYPKKRVLELTLPDNLRPLFGEVAEARFRALAQALDSEALVKGPPKVRAKSGAKPKVHK